MREKSMSAARYDVRRRQHGCQRCCRDCEVTADRERSESIHETCLEAVVENADARVPAFSRRPLRARAVGVRHDAIHRPTIEVSLSTEDGGQYDGCDRAQCENGARESLRTWSSQHRIDPPVHGSLAWTCGPAAVKATLRRRLYWTGEPLPFRCGGGWSLREPRAFLRERRIDAARVCNDEGRDETIKAPALSSRNSPVFVSHGHAAP